jgi:hypothetical protein
MAAIESQRGALERRSEAEATRWEKERRKLEDALRKGETGLESFNSLNGRRWRHAVGASAQATARTHALSAGRGPSNLLSCDALSESADAQTGCSPCDRWQVGSNLVLGLGPFWGWIAVPTSGYRRESWVPAHPARLRMAWE